jgi:lipoprotein-releasing system permease protein
MNVEYFISKRIISAKENKNVFSRPIIRITIFAIALSVAVMLISLSILDGFQSEIINKVISFSSHIQISNSEKTVDQEEIPLELTDSFLNLVQQNSGITDIHNIIDELGLVKIPNDFMGIKIKGVNEDYDFSAFSDKIIDGELLNSDSSIFISENIANKLRFELSDTIEKNKIIVYFPSFTERARVQVFYVCGVYNTKFNEFDEILTFVSLSKLQDLKGWKVNEVSLIEIKVSDFNKVDEVKESLKSSLDSITFVLLSKLQKLKKLKEDEIYLIDSTLRCQGSLDLQEKKSFKLSLNSLESSLDSLSKLKYPYKNIVSVKDLYPEIFDWLQLQDNSVLFIIILMLIVAVINIITSLLVLILEKTKFIGVLKSLGTSNWSIRKVFMYNSMYLVFKGLLWGNIIALSILFIQYHFQIISLDPETYYMETVPISFDVLSFLLLNIGTLIVCFVMMILPTIIITKISAVKAIRFE